MANRELYFRENLTKTYFDFYTEARLKGYPLEHCFHYSKIRFQEHVIHQMVEQTSQTLLIYNAYVELKNDRTLQERALAHYEENAHYESFFDGVNRS